MWNGDMTCLSIAIIGGVVYAAAVAGLSQWLRGAAQRDLYQERGVNQWARERGMEIPYPEAEKEIGT